MNEIIAGPSARYQRYLEPLSIWNWGLPAWVLLWTTCICLDLIFEFRHNIVGRDLVLRSGRDILRFYKAEWRGRSALEIHVASRHLRKVLLKSPYQWESVINEELVSLYLELLKRPETVVFANTLLWRHARLYGFKTEALPPGPHTELLGFLMRMYLFVSLGKERVRKTKGDKVCSVFQNREELCRIIKKLRTKCS